MTSNSDEAKKMAAASLKKSCEGGNVEGCFVLGRMHAEGIGVPRDQAQATSLYQKTCAQDWLAACTYYGALLAQQGPQRFEQALEALVKACDGGDSGGCVLLSTVYALGEIGEKQDQTRAKNLLARACDLGAEDACETSKRGR